MPVNLTNKDIGTRYALQEDFDKGFVGRDRQVVIQTDDPKGYRPVIMDGTTQGGKSKVALIADLSDYVSVSTYNSDKAGFETTTHASATYATKGELTSGLAGKANASHTHTKANITDFAHTHTKANITDFAHTHATSEVTGLDTALASKADTSALANYATKAEVPIITSSTTDLEAGTSPLATGTYYFVYE